MGKKIHATIFSALQDWEGVSREGVSRDSERLYVVESIHIQSGESDKVDSDFTLFQDPANPHGYYVRHPEGVHAVHMPWLKKLERFAGTESKGGEW